MVAPGQTPGQEDAPADASRARPDKTQGSEGQRTGEGGGEGAVAVVGRKRRLTRSRPKAGGKRTKTKRKVGRAGGAAKGPAAKKAKRPTGAKTGGGRKQAKKGPKKSARRTTAKKPTKTRAGAGKAGGKRNR